MGTEKPESAIPSIRTFATDLARSQNTTTTSTSVTPAVPATPAAPAALNATIVGAGESRIYQAPIWKKKPLPTKEEPKKAVTPPPTSSPLKPLVGPKKAEETEIIVDNEDAASATIIRDTKLNRFRLFPAIGASLSHWFGALKEKYFTKKAPKYTVPETTRRKGVIQKATSKTGKLATFDNTSLQARIKEREERVAPKTPTTIWTANTEPGYPLLEGPEDAKITNVQVVPRKSYRTETVPTPPPTPKPVPVTVPVPPPITAPASPKIIIASETEPIIEAVPPVGASVQIEVTRAPITNQETGDKVRVTNLRPTSFREWLFIINTNLISLGIAGAFVLIGIAGIIGYNWYMNNATTIEVSTTPNHLTYLNASLQILSTTESTRETVFSTLTRNQLASGGQTLLFAFATTPSGETLLPPQTIMSALDFKVSTPFVRSLNAVYFGITERRIPFMLLRTTDKNTALGGMLNWEASLYEDLFPMLEAHKDVLTFANTEATFKDVVTGGFDARALITSDEQILLVYNQPVKNIIIITTDTDSLQAILNLIQ